MREASHGWSIGGSYSWAVHIQVRSRAALVPGQQRGQARWATQPRGAHSKTVGTTTFPRWPLNIPTEPTTRRRLNHPPLHHRGRTGPAAPAAPLAAQQRQQARRLTPHPALAGQLAGFQPAPRAPQQSTMCCMPCYLHLVRFNSCHDSLATAHSPSGGAHSPSGRAEAAAEDMSYWVPAVQPASTLLRAAQAHPKNAMPFLTDRLMTCQAQRAAGAAHCPWPPQHCCLHTQAFSSQPRTGPAGTRSSMPHLHVLSASFSAVIRAAGRFHLITAPCCWPGQRAAAPSTMPLD
jgi:hypothetical protein